jgi:hypothetical protein
MDRMECAHWGTVGGTGRDMPASPVAPEWASDADAFIAGYLDAVSVMAARGSW